MPKKIKFESFKNHFLVNASEYSFSTQEKKQMWNNFLQEINFKYNGQYILIYRGSEEIITLKLDINEIKLYVRGDKNNEQNKLLKKNKYKDEIKINNKIYFKKIVSEVVAKAGFI
jgi:hypothetical protein